MTGNHIHIQNLKGISNLNFEIPSPGVHVLTASNGTGKTTLIACLQKLKNSSALIESFKKRALNVDNYNRSRITYSSRQGNSITYTYREASNSWRPTTQNAQAIRDFRYSQVIVIPTLGKRVYVQNQRLTGHTVRLASEELRTAMTRVLENPKFESLRRVGIGELRGKGGANRRNNIAFLLLSGTIIHNSRRINTYYSEISFSLGEIFALNLLFQLQSLQNNALVVIDELEVALHPRVQINLLNYLEEKAREKNLTIILSTHSSSLIKCAKSLIFLRSDNGNISVNYNCYPALALQEVAVEEDIQPDYVFFVEDRSGEYLLREMIRKYFQLNSSRQQPLWKVLPIGGWPEVVRFVKRSNEYLLNRRIGQYAFLDKDAEDEIEQIRLLGNQRSSSQNQFWELYNSENARIKFLNITPELGLWQWIKSDPVVANQKIQSRFQDSVINITRLIAECQIHIPNSSQNLRDDAKSRVSFITKKIANLTNEDYLRTLQHLFSAYIEAHYSLQANINELNALFGVIFNRRGNPIN